ncbi:MAG: hypothetical protein RR548_09810 [Carnobacterium sp.]|uniref:hypothetical protein n=1 Tax=Carnobacterium sp. TaxID=48221 RepID=UPI002FCC30F6
MTSEKQKKVKKTYLLPKDTVTKIEQFSAEKNLTYGGALSYFVDAYYENQSKENQMLLATIDTVLQKSMENMMQPMLEDLKRIRVTGNVVDRNTQMMLEFWNHYFVMSNAKALGSTEKYKTTPLIEAEVLIKQRISHNRQKKIDWEAKRKKDVLDE